MEGLGATSTNTFLAPVKVESFVLFVECEEQVSTR